jgi:hypothetical protein
MQRLARTPLKSGTISSEGGTSSNNTKTPICDAAAAGGLGYRNAVAGRGQGHGFGADDRRDDHGGRGALEQVFAEHRKRLRSSDDDDRRDWDDGSGNPAAGDLPAGRLRRRVEQGQPGAPWCISVRRGVPVFARAGFTRGTAGDLPAGKSRLRIECPPCRASMEASGCRDSAVHFGASRSPCLCARLSRPATPRASPLRRRGNACGRCGRTSHRRRSARPGGGASGR